VIGRTDHILNPGVETLDINGQSAPNGEYLTPVGIGHPEFGEIDLERLHTPFIFAGQGWNLDRRLGPNGCAEGVDCSADIDTALDPFPFSCLDPATQAPGTVPNGVAAFRTAILSALGGGAVASVEPVYSTLNCQ